ncbi:MAG: hypothetical protein J5449_10535 [Oscillospiraceae bacterium]|nr:hypothetical protein [Oscillospiraceae bacterium]
MIDFITYRKKLETAEAAYNAERTKRGEMTVEEFDEFIAKAEQFHGEKLNQKNLQRYQKIRNLMYDLMGIDGAVKASEERPSQDRYYANVHLYLSDCYGTQVKNLKPLIEAINLADEFTISTTDQAPAEIQLSWTVYDIWEK